jgi:hypothetical protein
MIYFDLMDVFLANVCRILLANIIEINEITEHLPLGAEEVYPWQNNPCKGTIDAVTSCLGPDFPDCIMMLMGGDDLPLCSDLQYWDFNDWMYYCAAEALSENECWPQVEAAEKCVDNCIMITY